ncbi:hypothetical protein J3R82DRAFT_9161 [Butyriboletus roseoflavus]|nr:hypothetical protein J3R82DRAFT_9161 [Butyriboletus roseoflavus]
MSEWPDYPHVDSISALCLSNNGKFIISASSSECSVKIWDVHTRSEIGSLKHTSEVLDVEISPDDGHLVCGVKDGKFSVWNLRRVLPMSYFFHSLTAFPTFPSDSDSHPIVSLLHRSGTRHDLIYRIFERHDAVNGSRVVYTTILLTGPSSGYACDNALGRLTMHKRVIKSLSVKPSLVAILAKSVAQSNQELYDAAIETLNVALENCDQEEEDFVNVIKAITFFDAGLRDDAIRHVNDLVVRSPDVKHLCAFVQAKMYSLLAADAMESRDFIRAIPLFAQARHLCPSGQYPEMDTVSLVRHSSKLSGRTVVIFFKGHNLSGISARPAASAKRTQQVLDTLREMESVFRDEIKLRSELSGWLAGFKSRCVEMLESQGDGAMHYDDAITQYTVALAINPTPLLAATLFMKRSKARAALSLWDDALKDAEEAIKLNPSFPLGYERKHTALHGLERYGDAINALTTMISILESSPDPEIRLLRGNYINPSDTKNAVLEVFRKFVDNSPFRLIDTRSGRLCDAEKRRKIFKEDPIFKELVSSMTTQLHLERINTVTRQYFQYVMLSHRWEAKELELADVLDNSIYELNTSPALTKLQRFCRLARDAKFRWAWSDTCCINRDKDVEFAKSINSMFHWYRCSAATIVYLTGVPPQMIPGALKESVWMTRGWTLQELLAPPVIRFYYEDWTPYLNNTSHNHKESVDIMQELEDATGVTAG